MMEVVTAHKGVLSFETTVTGLEWHSSQPNRGVNAVQIASEIVHALSNANTMLSEMGKYDERFDPPHTTVHVGTIHGGTARNILAKLCAFNWEVRGVPGTDEREAIRMMEAFAEATVLPRLRAHGWPASVETVIEVDVPGLAPEPGSPAETLALRLAGHNSTMTVPYGTDAAELQAIAPCVVLGPGAITTAHTPRECARLSDLAEAVTLYRRLLRGAA
jgi:acetylornithine deacetylase